MARTNQRPPAEPQIDDEVTIGGLPGGNGSEPTPGTEISVRVGAEHQYVSGSRLQWYSTYPRALPWALDDITTDFGDDLYERMLLDPQVRANVNVLKASVLETGAEFVPAVDDKTDPDYEQAVELVGQAERMIDKLDQSLDDVLWDMLDAEALGSRVAEQVYTLDTTPSGRREYALHSLTPKPRESVAFVVDVYLNVLGILGRVPGQPFPVQQGSLLADLEHTTNLLPRSKFAVLTSRPRNGDPRGTSVLRPAFDPWNQKQQLKREFLKYLTQFASPSLIGFTADEANPYLLTNPDGSLALDANGNPIQRTPEQDMVASLEKFANGTATAFPFGSLVKWVEMTGQGEPFLNAFRWHDQQITKSILHQTLATEEGEHQTRAASGTHKDVLDTLIRQRKRPVQRMLERDVFGTWLRLNGLERLLPLRPRVQLGSSAQEDIAGLWTAAAALQRANYLHSSQYTDLDQVLNLPERTPPNATTIPVLETVQVKEDAGDVPPPDGQESDADTTEQDTTP